MTIDEALNKFNEIVMKYEIAEDTINDLITAICTSDMLYGTNNMKLDIGRFVSSINGRYTGILGNGCDFRSYKPLPEVQVLRVLCDTLILGVGSKDFSAVKDLGLTIPSSGVVAKAFGISKFSDEYSDVVGCDNVIDFLYGFTKNDGELSEFESRLCSVISVWNSFSGSALSTDILHSITKDVLIPFKTRFLGSYSSSSTLSEDNIIELMVGKIMIYLTDLFIDSLKKVIKSNKVKANLKLLSLTKEISLPIGLNSIGGVVPTYEYRSFEGTTAYYNAKLDKIFSNSIGYSKEDIPKLLSAIIFIQRDLSSYSATLQKFSENWFGGRV